MIDSKLGRLWAKFGHAAVVGGVCFVLSLVFDRALHWFSITDVTLNDATRGSLFGSLIQAVGVLLSVFLAVLAVVTSLDETRPIVVLMKQTMGVYDELVLRIVGPIYCTLLVLVLSIVCLILPSKVEGRDIGWLMLVPSLTISIALGVFAQTASVARLLGQILLYRGRKPGTKDSAEAAKARMEARRAAAATAAEPTSSSTAQTAAVTG